jgi:hypothetical protein
VTQPPQIEALTAQLLTDLTAAHQRILTLLDDLAQAWPGLSVTARRARLTALDAQVRTLMANADALAARHVMTATAAVYQMGATVTALTVGAGVGFTAVDTSAVTALAADMMSDLLTATKGVRLDVKALIRDLTRQHVRDKIITGQTAMQAAADLTRELQARGITAITYVNGARMPLPAYAEMVVRTKSATTYQEGGLNQGARLGIEWWEVMDGPGCGWLSHTDPDLANGKIVNLADAREHPLSHPHCRRVTTPRPDIQSAEDAAGASPVGPKATEAVWDAAARQYVGYPVTASTTAARTTAAVSTSTGTLPNTAAGRRHAATLARHSA